MINVCQLTTSIHSLSLTINDTKTLKPLQNEMTINEIKRDGIEFNENMYEGNSNYIYNN